MTTDDTAEISQIDDAVILTEVPSGKLCKLVSVIRRRKGMKTIGKHRHRFEETKKHVLQEKHHHQHERGHHGGRRILRRLLDLGITTGCEFEVIQGGSSGPVLVQVRGTRVALGHGLASKLLVKVIG
ncbi:MAG: FeoA family protein [Candidatus Thorarchaeota archaeon]|jgi:ferrous iron transport protein A